MKFEKYEKVEKDISTLYEQDGLLLDEYGNRYDYDDYGNLCMEIVEEDKVKEEVKEKVEKYVEEGKKSKSQNGFEFKMLEFKDIAVAKRIRVDSLEDNKGELNRSISEYGILEPLIVIPYNDTQYLLVDGYRRLCSAGMVGLKEIPCIVNYNIDIQNKMMLEAMLNKTARYTMEEKIAFAHKVSSDGEDDTTVEELAQLEEGDFEKIKVIESANNEKLIEKVMGEKMDIEKAYKLALKEQEEPEIKEEVEEEPEEEPQDVDLTINKLDPLSEEFTKKILERDEYTCECCGVQGDIYNNVVEPHLIKPLYAGGKEKEDNAITVCNRCHKQIHLYSVDKVEKPETLDEDEYNELSEDKQIEYNDKQKFFKHIEKYGKELKKYLEETKADKVTIEAETEQIGGESSVEM